MALLPLAHVASGLDRVAALPVGRGYASVTAAVDVAGAVLRGEVGWHPRANVDVFGFGEVAGRWGQPVTAMAGIGARLRF